MKKLIPLTICLAFCVSLALGAVGPKLDSVSFRFEPTGCIYLDFETDGGEPGWYYISCRSSDYILPDYWIRFAIITNTGEHQVFGSVPCFIDFTNNALFRLERLQ